VRQRLEQRLAGGSGVASTAEAKPHLFVSYSRKDQKVVDWIAKGLEASGFTVWIDRTRILAGTPWQKVIPAEIRRAEALLLIITPEAMDSDWVRREYFYALSRRVPIIPVLLKRAEPPPGINKHLSNLQAVVLYNRRQRGLNDLVTALGGLRGVAAQVPGAARQRMLRENTRLVFELLRLMQTVAPGNGRLILTGGPEKDYYIQFLCLRDDPEVIAEAVGNDNLETSDLLLRDEQIEKLLELGWERPNKTSYGNYRRVWEARNDDARQVIAGVVVRTFVEVYGHPPGEEIEVNEIDLS
jgi:hypothetical protein